MVLGTSSCVYHGAVQVLEDTIYLFCDTPAVSTWRQSRGRGSEVPALHHRLKRAQNVCDRCAAMATCEAGNGGGNAPPLPDMSRLFRLEQFLRFIGFAGQVSSITALYDDLDDLIDRSEVISRRRW